MKQFIRILSILSLLFIVALVAAQSPEDESPQAYLMRYINTLNRQDYATAYAMIDNRNDSYEDFAAGYADTLRIVPYFGRAGVAAGSTYMTSVLVAYQADGTIENYYGYFQLHSGALYSPIRNNGGWVIGNARFQLLQTGDALHNGTIQEILPEEWQEDLELPPTILSLSEMNSPEALAMLSYYDLINSGQFETAYAQWLTTSDGITRDYRLPYQQFVTGYADTAYVTGYFANPQAIPQRGVNNSYLPSVLIAQKIDGSFETYSGCYALGILRNGQMGIINGRFTLLTEGVPQGVEGVSTGEIILDVLNNLNCASLGMGI